MVSNKNNDGNKASDKQVSLYQKMLERNNERLDLRPSEIKTQVDNFSNLSKQEAADAIDEKDVEIRSIIAEEKRQKHEPLTDEQLNAYERVLKNLHPDKSQKSIDEAVGNFGSMDKHEASKILEHMYAKENLQKEVGKLTEIHQVDVEKLVNPFGGNEKKQSQKRTASRPRQVQKTH